MLELGTPADFFLLAMAVMLKDALNVVAASADLGLFADDGSELSLLLTRLRDIDVESCEDFRLAFITDDEIDNDALKAFGTGDMFPYRELLWKFAQEVIPDGAFTGSVSQTSELKKRACPSHLVCGRLVYRKLEDYCPPKPDPKPLSSGISFRPSSSTLKLRNSVAKSVARMEDKIARGVVKDKTSHLTAKSTSLHERADGVRDRAIDVGFDLLGEAGNLSPRYSQVFGCNGDIVLDEGTRMALSLSLIHI